MKPSIFSPAVVAALLVAVTGYAAENDASNPQSTKTPQPTAAAKTKNVEVVVDGVAGFQDTVLQPDGQWHVHDPARPQPPAITPGAAFSENAKPPADATVLFDGTDLSGWTDKQGHPAPWRIEDGVMVSAKSDIVSKQQFGDLQLHLEFREPVPAKGEGQGRGNSGVFLMGQYEVQVLDCYQNKTYADGSTGGLYGQHPPLANVCRPPGEWQTYDIIFNVPHFGANGEVITPAYVTVIQNGVVVQNHQAFRGATNWKSPGKYTAHGPTGPLGLQYHNNAVAFRNIWVRPVPVVQEP
ncbi:MAG TPA: DUF1080 domain-containing protein [Verrucomicrobiae bacterium]